MIPLTIELLDFLRTPQAQEALANLAGLSPTELAALPLLMGLRKTFSAREAGALVDQARLRLRAGDKFPEVTGLLFEDEALQQASSRRVAAYRAQQFARFSRVADLGCGIGADTIALAEAGLQVLAVERDPVRAGIAMTNVDALGLADRVQVLCADWTTLSLDVEAAFIDPSRRAGERRIYHLDAMDPPISAVEALRSQVPNIAVKTMPGIADDEAPGDADVEFISEHGHMKEALLRFGGLRLGTRRTATLLPGPLHLDDQAALSPIPALEPMAYLYEPDPAVLRARLVRHLASQIGAAQLDATIAYLTADTHVATPFGRAWRVVRHGPFHLKTLNRWLQDLGAGQLVVKKRGSPIDPEAFRQRLKPVPDGWPATIFLTRVRGRPWMIVGRGTADGQESADQT